MLNAKRRKLNPVDFGGAMKWYRTKPLLKKVWDEQDPRQFENLLEAIPEAGHIRLDDEDFPLDTRDDFEQFVTKRPPSAAQVERKRLNLDHDNVRKWEINAAILSNDIQEVESDAKAAAAAAANAASGATKKRHQKEVFQATKKKAALIKKLREAEAKLKNAKADEKADLAARNERREDKRMSKIVGVEDDCFELEHWHGAEAKHYENRMKEMLEIVINDDISIDELNRIFKTWTKPVIRWFQLHIQNLSEKPRDSQAFQALLDLLGMGWDDVGWLRGNAPAYPRPGTRPIAPFQSSNGATSSLRMAEYEKRAPKKSAPKKASPKQPASKKAARAFAPGDEYDVKHNEVQIPPGAKNVEASRPWRYPETENWTQAQKVLFLKDMFRQGDRDDFDFKRFFQNEQDDDAKRLAGHNTLEAKLWRDWGVAMLLAQSERQQEQVMGEIARREPSLSSKPRKPRKKLPLEGNSGGRKKKASKFKRPKVNIPKAAERNPGEATDEYAKRFIKELDRMKNDKNYILGVFDALEAKDPDVVRWMTDWEAPAATEERLLYKTPKWRRNHPQANFIIENRDLPVTSEEDEKEFAEQFLNPGLGLDVGSSSADVEPAAEQEAKGVARKPKTRKPKPRQSDAVVLSRGQQKERDKYLREAMAGAPEEEILKVRKDMYGFGMKQKRANPWVQHVRAYAKEHGIRYGQALSDPAHSAACRAAYYGGEMQLTGKQDDDVMVLPTQAEMMGVD